MSLESVATAAGTTVPAVRRRFRNKVSLVVAVVDSLRVQELPDGTLLAEEHRHPEVLAAFRTRLVEPRRAALSRALAEGVSSGELPDSADPDVLASMLIGSFYGRYVATSDLPADWAEQSLRQVWPDAGAAP